MKKIKSYQLLYSAQFNKGGISLILENETNPIVLTNLSSEDFTAIASILQYPSVGYNTVNKVFGKIVSDADYKIFEESFFNTLKF